MSSVTNHHVKTHTVELAARTPNVIKASPSFSAQMGKFIATIVKIAFAIIFPPYLLYKLYEAATAKPAPKVIVITPPKETAIHSIQKAITDHPKTFALMAATTIATVAVIGFYLNRAPEPVVVVEPSTWLSAQTMGYTAAGLVALAGLLRFTPVGTLAKKATLSCAVNTIEAGGACYKKCTTKKNKLEETPPVGGANRGDPNFQVRQLNGNE